MIDYLVLMPDDPKGPNPVKLKKPFKLNGECYWHVKTELFKYIEMFMDHLDFEMFPWDVDDPEDPTKKYPMYVQDMNVIRKMYKLKHLYEQQKIPNQPNSNNWNFGSPPPQLMKKS